MGLSTHIIRRLLLVIPMLIGVTLVTFTVSHLVPVDPLVVIVSEKALDKPDIVAAAIEKWGLNRSLPEQYLYYVWNLAQGDLGVSFKTKRPVTQDLAQYLPATMDLGLASLFFALLFGLPLGIIAAVNSGRWIDHVARFISLLGASMPPFWSGLMVLFLFYSTLGLLPGPGRVDSRMIAPAMITGLYLLDTLLAGDFNAFADVARHLIMPSVILGWFTLALICRVTRANSHPGARAAQRIHSDADGAWTRVRGIDERRDHDGNDFCLARHRALRGRGGDQPRLSGCRRHHTPYRGRLHLHQLAGGYSVRRD
jgi:peptide/nickel transport system permease protein